MSTKSTCLAAAIIALPFVGIGCNRQDAERLSSIGRKVAAHAKTSAGDLGPKFDVGLKKEPSLQERIQDRLRSLMFTRSLGVTVVRPGLIEIRAEVTLTASMR